MERALQLLDLGLEQFGLLLMAVRLLLVEIRQVLDLLDVELLKQRLNRLEGATAAPDKREPRTQCVALRAQVRIDLMSFGDHICSEQLG